MYQKMQYQPLVSIIIPTFNRADLLKLCLDSVISQTYHNWEAIIIDNHSVDINEQVVASYMDERLKFYKNSNDGIIAISRNKGISLATGEVICFLDSDDIWSPNKLETIIPYLTDYDLIYHDMLIYHYKNETIQLSKRLRGRTLKGDLYIDALMDGNPCINSSLVVKRSLIEKVGTISEDREIIGVEDFDYLLRMLPYAKVKFVSRVLGYYYVGQSSISNTDKQVHRMEVLYERHLPNIYNEDLRKEIKCRLSYKQARIYQIHGNKSAATLKFKEALRTKSMYYYLRSILFLLLIKLS